MPGKARLASIFPVLVVIVLSLQGCSVSGGGSDDNVPNVVGTPNIAFATTSGIPFLLADGVSTVTMQLTATDANGQGLAGLAVTFNSTAGTLTVPAPIVALRANGGSSVSTTTNGAGVAQVTLTSSMAVETATVSARTDTGGGTSVAPTPLTINFISGAPAQIALQAVPLTVGVGDTSAILATVSTATNDPVEGVTVTFSFEDNNSGGSLLPSNGTTNANGEVSITYRAGSVISTDIIRASTPGDAGDVTGTINVAVQATTVTANSLTLLVSSPQLDSDGSEIVTLTALVRDVNNNFVANATVTFAASSGGIEVTSGTTNASGRATASLETAGDPSNRLINVTAAAGTLASANTVSVTGTTITLSGTNTLVLNQTATLSILLQDSGGNGIPAVIALSSRLGNTLSAPTVTTNASGQAMVQVTATVAGNDTISATALGATGTLPLTVSAANFAFTAPDPGTEIPLNTDQAVRIHFERDTVPRAGAVINFTATRGMFGGQSTATDTTNESGNAQVALQANNAGPAVITASCTDSDDCDGGLSTQIEIEFVATDADSLILQATPTTLGINTGGSMAQQSIITAVVRDADGNLVKNKTVNFTLTDVSGGRIFPASAVTDSFGRASTVYTAGAASSAQDGVIVDACVPTDPDDPPAPCDRVTLTVAQQPLFVILGTGNTVQVVSPTQYAKPYSALVTDANSNPIAGARVELNVFPTRYQKGFYTLFFDEFELCIGWGKVLTVTTSSTLPNPDNVDQACDNEDSIGTDGTRNGILDLDLNEDRNTNGRLDPGNVAVVPLNVTTDASGIAEFVVTYPKDRTWVEIDLEARATVAGSEGFNRVRFFLPGLADDFADCDVSPPGQVSPYGVATTCGCDELADATCPTIVGLTPITFAIVAGTVPIQNNGGTVTFRIGGGTRTSYTVSTNVGTLRNAGGTSGASVVVNFNEMFDLVVAGNTTNPRVDITITLTATDLVTGAQDTTTITQN